MTSMSTIGRGTLQRTRAKADTGGMHFRRERVRVETARQEIEGTPLLPNEGFRSRTTDFLNAHGDDFLALTDADVTWLDGARAPERHEFLAVAARHVVMLVELESLGVFDESGATPAVETLSSSAPPPSG
jgi:hypothetical protein